MICWVTISTLFQATWSTPYFVLAPLRTTVTLSSCSSIVHRAHHLLFPIPYLRNYWIKFLYIAPTLWVSSQQQVITSLPYTAFSRLETSEVPNSSMESNRQLLKKKKKSNFPALLSLNYCTGLGWKLGCSEILDSSSGAFDAANLRTPLRNYHSRNVSWLWVNR